MGFPVLQSLGDLLPYAVPVALSPLPVIAMVVLLLAPAGTRGGMGFLMGRVATLAVIAFGVALLAGRIAAEPGGADRGGWLRIGLGCLLNRRSVRDVAAAAGAAAMPAWMRSLDRAGAGRAMQLGAMLNVLNVKEIAFVVGAGTLSGRRR